MTAHEFMENIKQCRRKIRLLNEAIGRDRVLAAGVKGIRYDKDIVQSSPVADRMADIVARIIENTNALEEEIMKLQLYESEMRDYLLQLQEKLERALSLHYLDGRNWAEVAVIMNYDDVYIYKVRDKALEELDAIIATSEKKTANEKNIDVKC